MTGRGTPLWLFVVAAAFVAYFVVLLHLESQRVDSIGFRVAFTAGAMNVQRVAPGSAAAASGVRAGDRIVEAAVRPIRVRGDWHAVEANLSAGKPVSLIVERGESRQRLWLTPRRSESSFWGTRAGLVLIIARLTQLVALGTACLMVFRRPRDRHVQLGAWLLGSGGVFSIVLPIGFATAWRELPTLVGAVLWLPFASSICVGAILFSFFAAFPRPVFTSKWLWTAAWTPMIIVAAPFVSAFASAVYRPDLQGEPLDATLVMIASAFYEAAGIIVLALNYTRLPDITERRRVQVIVPGSVAALLSGIVVALASLRRGQLEMSTPLFASPVLAIGVLVMLALPISFAYAILSRRMFDFATLLRAGVRYALARRVVIVVPILLLALLVADLSAHADMALGRLIAWRLLVYLPLVALAGLGIWYRERWLEAIDRRFFRQRYDAELILRGIISDLRQSGTVEAVAPSLVARLELALHPAVAALMQHTPSRPAFETIASAPAGAAPAPLSATSKVIALARVLGGPLQLGTDEDGHLLSRLPPSERRLIADARIELLTLVPSRGEDDRELLIALGPKRSQEPYGRGDLDLITGVADALSLAAERAPQPATPCASLEECPTCGTCYDSGTLRCPGDDRALETGRMARVLAARYRLDRRIGEGGMSRLYSAMDLALQRDVAVKVLREQWLTTPDSEARFRREARLAAALSHPNIITIFDFGVSAKTAFLVMELLRGRTLRDELRAHQRLALPEVLGIVRTVALAVDAAHARGLIHRDLKPENVFLAGSATRGTIKVLDFGLAKSLGADEEFSTGPVMMGTPHYMAPEQLRGEPPQPSWDLWALGVITYELLSGSPPFLAPASVPAGAESASGYRPMPGLGPLAAPALSGELEVLNPFFASALAIDAAGRPGTAAAFVSAFESAAAGVWIA